MASYFKLHFSRSHKILPLVANCVVHALINITYYLYNTVINIVITVNSISHSRWYYLLLCQLYHTPSLILPLLPSTLHTQSLILPLLPITFCMQSLLLPGYWQLRKYETGKWYQCVRIIYFRNRHVCCCVLFINIYFDVFIFLSFSLPRFVAMMNYITKSDVTLQKMTWFKL